MRRPRIEIPILRPFDKSFEEGYVPADEAIVESYKKFNQDLSEFFNEQRKYTAIGLALLFVGITFQIL